MKKIGASIICIAALFLITGCAAPKHPPIQSGYAPVNGLRMYYEIHGSNKAGQPPLVLLHGGDPTITTSFGKLLPGLAKDRRVIAFEQQGHGILPMSIVPSASNNRPRTRWPCLIILTSIRPTLWATATAAISRS